MEISAEKTKLMTNNTSGINTEIKVNGQKLETVKSFKYLGSVITDEGSKPEILSPTLFNIFLERIMTDALEDHEGTVSIGGRTITNLRFAHDIDGLAGEEEELAN